MQVLAIRQLLSGIHAFSSNDIFVCKSASADTLFGDGESELFSIPVEFIQLVRGEIEAHLDPDPTFYAHVPDSPLGDWSGSDEYKRLIEQYQNAGWSIYKPLPAEESH